MQLAPDGFEVRASLGDEGLNVGVRHHSFQGRDGILRFLELLLQPFSLPSQLRRRCRWRQRLAVLPPAWYREASCRTAWWKGEVGLALLPAGCGVRGAACPAGCEWADRCRGGEAITAEAGFWQRKQRLRCERLEKPHEHTHCSCCECDCDCERGPAGAERPPRRASFSSQADGGPPGCLQSGFSHLRRCAPFMVRQTGQPHEPQGMARVVPRARVRGGAPTDSSLSSSSRCICA